LRMLNAHPMAFESEKREERCRLVEQLKR